MEVKERVAKLRELMEKNGIDVYMVPTADFHNSEYVGEHFKSRGFYRFSGDTCCYKRFCRFMDRWEILLAR